MKIWGLVVALLSCTTTSSSMAQQAIKTVPGSGAVSGSVFLITKAGDIKPARFAHVYLLYLWSGKPSDQDKEANKEDATAGLVYLDKQNIELQEETNETKGDPTLATSESLSCKRRLLTLTKALSSTIEWIDKSKHGKQLLAIDTDEEGSFRLRQVPPGRYTIVAKGKAGVNQAFWTSEVYVHGGQTAALKLPSPEISCVEME